MRATVSKLRLAVSASALTLAMGAFPGQANAATCNWLTAAGNWVTSGNWSCGTQPGSADDVIINTAGGAVTLTGTTGQASTLTLGIGNTLTVTGADLIMNGSTLTNNGTITFGASSRFRAAGILNIGGTGTIVLDNSGGYARVGEFGGTFNFGAGQTIRGQGEFGFNSANFSNAGLVSADVSGATLVVDTAGGSGSTTFINTGIMQATGGGTLRIDGGGYDNSGAVIRAINGGTVVINNDARIIGGSLTTNTGGVLTTAGTSFLQNATVTAGSNLAMGANSDILINGALTINGTLTTGAATRVRAEGANAVTINGTGDLLLDNSASYARIGEFGGSFTLGSSLTVHGRGELGFNSANFTNNGLVSADVSGAALVVDTAGGSGSTTFTNAAIMQATGGGTLRIDGGGYDNNGAVIRATNNGTVLINSDARIIGGSLTSNTGGVITSAGTSFLQNATLTTGSNLTMGSGSDILINGTLTNNGTLTLAGNTRLRAENAGVVTINGTGNIVLGAGIGTYSRIGEYGGTFIFGSNQNVSGSGEIGFNSALIANNNVFSFAAGSNVNIDAQGGSGGVVGGLGSGGNAGFLNNGSIVADNSIVHILNGYYDNQAGILRAVNGGTIDINNDARIVGGTLTTTTGGVFTTAGTSYLQNATLTAGSNFNIGASSDVIVNGTLTVNGTLAMTTGSNRLRAEGAGAVTINGTGDVLMAQNYYSRIGEYGGVFTLGSGLTVHGSGEVGFNSASFINNGLISADANGATLSVDTVGGSGSTTFVNNSILQAINGATLSIGGGGYDNNAGVIRATGSNSIAIIQSDARIIGGSLTSNTGGVITNAGTSFLQNTTLTAGSNLTMGANSDILINGVLTVNGTLTTAAGTRLRAESAGAVTINGAGDILLDNSSFYSRIGEYGGTFTFGSGLTVHGAGEIGFNSAVFTNNGLISADGGTGISLDAAGGSGGIGGGVGTGGTAGLFNTGTIQAANGKTLSVQGGLYENGATGTFGAVGAGSQFVLNSDANLTNIQAGGVLSLGKYVSSTTGAASTLNIRGTGANSISTIGTGASGTDTTVTLSGANSVFNVTNFSTGVNTTLDSTLTTVASSGRLNLLNGRNLNIIAGAGSLTNNGIVQLGGGALTSTSSNGFNTGLMTGFGSIGFDISNSGIVEALGGTLATRAIGGGTGTMRSTAGATLDISAGTVGSSAGFLTNNGTLALGANNVLVFDDYQNANFGLGNAFSKHANVTGSGLILASSATMDLSGPALSGGTLNVGNVRTGGSSSTTLTITNNGTATTLRGAVQNGSAPSVALSTPDFVLTPGGGSATVTISYTGLTAGSLSGQTLNVVNNFDNVANATVGLAGNIYQVAQAGTQPSMLVLGARRVGDAAGSATITIANVAPITPGFNEALRANASVNNSFLLNGAGTATVNNLAAGNSAPVTLTRGTGTAGSFTGTVTIANTSLAVAGSGLADLALANQTIAVSNNVYATAVANVTGATVNFGTVRRGAANPTGSVGVANGASGALTDSLVTTVGATPANVIAGAAPGPLAAGQSGNVAFSLSTAAAGIVSGSTQLGFTSSNTEMADLTLASQTVNFAGTITDLSVASIFKNTGAGTFSGSGTTYTYDLGTLTANSGSFVTDFGVANLVTLSSFSEALGGSFSQTAGTGYTFNGNIFSGVQGGSSNIGNLLTFDTTGLGSGTYGKTFTFNGYSAYPGLNNQNLAPITVTITAQVTGGGGGTPGAVPEPATWAMMIIGFGMIGGTMRRTTNRRAGTAV